MTEIQILVILVIIAALSVAMFLAGKMHERIQWNQLIQDGKIPRPGQTN